MNELLDEEEELIDPSLIDSDVAAQDMLAASREAGGGSSSGAGYFQALAQISNAISGSDKKVDPAVFDAVRKAASERNKFASVDAAAKRKAVADAIKGNRQQKWHDESLQLGRERNEAMLGQQKLVNDRVAAEATAKREKEAAEAAEKAAQLETEYGTANTPDDAKQLKEAGETRKNFDSKLTELINLRTKYGAEKMDQNAIGRAKMLANELKLDYKTLAKLGQISGADTEILDSIIPPDPLGYQGTAAVLQGQDPILEGMTKFKGDIGSEFENKLSSRIRPGTRKGPPAKVETKTINGVQYKKVKGGWEPV